MRTRTRVLTVLLVIVVASVGVAVADASYCLWVAPDQFPPVGINPSECRLPPVPPSLP